MIYGDGSEWLSHFRSLAERLTPYLVAMAPICTRPLGTDADEDAITRGLVVLLTRNATVRRFARVEYHFEPFRSDAYGRVDSLGQIDFVAWTAGGWPRDAYLAYECKRLNVTTGTGTRSRAPEYVKCGVRRFVTEQYSEGLPFACMLGYVLDGRVSKAKQSVQIALHCNAATVALVDGPTALPGPRSSSQFATTHARARSGKMILVRHGLVSCI